MRILFVIRALDFGGGAERQLTQLARALRERGDAVAVAVMYPGGALERELEQQHGVRILRLDKRSRWDTFGFMSRSLQLCRDFNPDIVHGYMSGANELALLLGWLLRRPAVWGIRVSDQDFADYSGFRQAVFRMGCSLSRFPALLIANSHKGREFHVAHGYPVKRFEVIPNGIDVTRFHRDAERGADWRRRHGISADTSLVVLPARLDPMKDHRTFLDAVALAAPQRPDLHFIAVGRGNEEERSVVETMIRERALEKVVTLLPAEERVEDLYNAADIVTLTSAFGEGFPNVLGEAMACGRLCVATDTGDAAIVIGGEGRIVPIRSPAALAEAWLSILALSPAERAALEGRARTRMVESFGIEVLVGVTQQHFQRVVRDAA